MKHQKIAFICILLLALTACRLPDSGPDSPVLPGKKAPVEPTPSVSSCTDLDCAYLEAHNLARTNASPAPSPALPAMTWSTTVADAARTWAEQCTFGYDPNLGTLAMGQSIYASTNTHAPSVAVDSWSAHGSQYDYTSNSCSSGTDCGYYTQIVWRETTELGCVRVVCSSGSPFGASNSGNWYLSVCNYSERGGYLGQRPY